MHVRHHNFQGVKGYLLNKDTNLPRHEAMLCISKDSYESPWSKKKQLNIAICANHLCFICACLCFLFDLEIRTGVRNIKVSFSRLPTSRCADPNIFLKWKSFKWDRLCYVCACFCFLFDLEICTGVGDIKVSFFRLPTSRCANSKVFLNWKSFKCDRLCYVCASLCFLFVFEIHTDVKNIKVFLHVSTS